MTVRPRNIPDTGLGLKLLPRSGNLLGLGVGRTQRPSASDGYATRFAADCLQCAPQAMAIRRDAKGQPTLATPSGDVCLSQSHAEPLILVGLATRPIGVDLEPLGQTGAPAWNILHPGERDRLDAIGDNDARHHAFVRLWTAKEAWVKALGEGFRREPSSFEIRIEGARSFSVLDPVTSLAPVFAATGSFDADGQVFLWSCVII